MERKCSIWLLISGIIISGGLCLSIGFLAGIKKNQTSYEERIALLTQQNKILIQQKETAERESYFTESLKVMEPYEYVLLAEDGYVAVYYTDRKTLYAVTDIRLEALPQDLQEEIHQGKFIGNEEQLYNFLENYTS